MEARKIIIIDSKNQSQKSFMSTATTLGALKSEMSELNINYEGSTFYCGQMRAELVDDAAPIPETVMYKGEAVRDLTFMLTTPNKKIKSGNMNRMEIYQKIRELNLQDACKAKYGKNFTMCSTVNLLDLIDEVEHSSKIEKPIKEEPKVEETKSTCSCSGIEAAFKCLIDSLYDDDFISDCVYDECKKMLNSTPSSYSEDKSDKMSQAEIDDMFDFVNKH